jgi:ABC-type dipeptide/oligopeptide/nickel transport system permease subunit
MVQYQVKLHSERKRFRFRAGWFGLILLGLIILLCLGTLPYTLGTVRAESGPLTRRYEASNLNLNLLPPAWMHLDEMQQQRLVEADHDSAIIPGRVLGTDKLGRDFFVRCMMGGGISLGIGLCAALLAIVLGTSYGMVAGYFGGRIDSTLMRIVDVLYGLPYILLVVLLAVAVEGLVDRLGTNLSSGNRQLINVATLLVAIGGIGWLTMARVIRGQVLSLRQQPFMESCTAAGIGLRRKFSRHLLPNLVGPIVVYAALAVPAAILSESFLSFLGIGVREPLPSWGNLAAEGLNELNTVRSRWWLLVFPCLLIGVTLISLNFLGDHLRSRFDPTSNRA